MTEADIKIAAYQDAIMICQATMDRYGELPKVACRHIAALLQDRIEEIADREIHAMAVWELG